jgi:hypothetical protein
MITFAIAVNGEKLSTAGLDGPGVVTSAVTWVRGEPKKKGGVAIDYLHFRVGGLISRTGTHVLWLKRDLKVGDEVRITVIENKRADKPKKNQIPRTTQLALDKKYVEARAAKLGWRIQK